MSLLISLDVDCSGCICCGAGWFPPTACCPRTGLNPVCAVEPEAPWKTVDMDYLEMMGCDLRGGRKLTAREGRRREAAVYAGSTASDSMLAQIHVNRHMSHSQQATSWGKASTHNSCPQGWPGQYETRRRCSGESVVAVGSLPPSRWLEVLGSGDTQDFRSRAYLPRLQHIDDQLEISLTAKGGCSFKLFQEKPNEQLYRLWVGLFKI